MSRDTGKLLVTHRKSTPEVEQVRILIREMLQTQIHQLRRTRKDLDLDAPELEVLMHLMTKGSTNPTEIAHRLGVSTAATSVILQRLENMGHLTRSPDPSDGRRVIVCANKESIKAARKSGEKLVENTVKVLEELSANELKIVSTFLKKLVVALRPENEI